MTAFSQIRHQKLTHLFNILDVDNNGFINTNDIQAFIDAVAQSRNYTSQSLAYRALKRAYLGLWEKLSQQLDTNADQHISQQEWLTFFASVEQEADFENQFVRPIELAMVKLLDIDGDGKVRLNDYQAFGRACNIPQAEIERLFKVMDTDGDGVLTEYEAGRAIVTFLLSDDDNAPGNWFFGNYRSAS